MTPEELAEILANNSQQLSNAQQTLTADEIFNSRNQQQTLTADEIFNSGTTQSTGASRQQSRRGNIRRDNFSEDSQNRRLATLNSITGNVLDDIARTVGADEFGDRLSVATEEQGSIGLDVVTGLTTGLVGAGAIKLGQLGLQALNIGAKGASAAAGATSTASRFGQAAKVGAVGGGLLGAAAGSDELAEGDLASFGLQAAGGAAIGGTVGGALGTALPAIAAIPTQAINRIARGVTGKQRQQRAIDATLQNLESNLSPAFPGVTARAIAEEMRDGNVNIVEAVSNLTGSDPGSIETTLRTFVIRERDAGNQEITRILRNQLTDYREGLAQNSISRRGLAEQRREAAGDELRQARIDTPTSDVNEILVNVFNRNPDGRNRIFAEIETELRDSLDDPINSAKFDAADYSVGEEARIGIRTQSGQGFIIKKGAEALEEESEEAVSIVTNGSLKQYDPDDLIELDMNGEIISSAKSEINAPIQQGTFQSQEKGARKQRVSDVLGAEESNIPVGESGTLGDLKDKYLEISAANKLVDETARVASLGDKATGKDANKLISTAKDAKTGEDLLDPLDRLRMIMTGIEEAELKGGSVGSALTVNNSDMVPVLREAIKANRKSDGTEYTSTEIDNIIEMMKLQSGKANASIGGGEIEQGMMQAIATGTMHRWYLGPGRAVAASAAWETLTSITGKSRFRSLFSNVSEEQRIEIIRNLIGQPDEQYLNFVTAVVERRDLTEAMRQLVGPAAPISGSIAGGQVVEDNQ